MDVSLLAVEGLGEEDRGITSGSVISLSATPYGVTVPDGASAVSVNTVTVAQTAKVEAGINNEAVVHIKPMTIEDGPDGGEARDQVIDPARIGTLLTTEEKGLLGVPAEIAYHYAALDLGVIPFGMSDGVAIRAVDGAFAQGIAGHYYEYIGADGAQIDLQTENFFDASRWVDRGTNTSVAPLLNLALYDSDVTDTLRDALQGKFFVIKPVELDSPSFSYQNIGNLLLAQRDKVIDWITNHGTNAEAVARYQVQLEVIEDALEELGLLEHGRHACRSRSTWCSSSCPTSMPPRARCSCRRTSSRRSPACSPRRPRRQRWKPATSWPRARARRSRC